MSDFDLIMICPFDSNHKVKVSKMHNHLMRCRRSHPELDKILEVCSFNALHRFHPDERDKHYEECIERRKILNNQQLREQLITADVSVPHYTRNIESSVNNDEEDWDEGKMLSSMGKYKSKLLVIKKEPVVSIAKSIPEKEPQLESTQVPHDRKRVSSEKYDKNEDNEPENSVLAKQQKRIFLDSNSESNQSQDKSKPVETKAPNIKTSANTNSILNSNNDTKNETETAKGVNYGTANNVPKRICVGRGILMNRK